LRKHPTPELRIALSAYEAATDPSKWSGVLRDLMQHCGASKAALFTPVEHAMERFLWCDVGMDPELLQAYSHHWVKEDAWIEAHAAQHLYVAGNVHIGSDYLPWPQLERTGFFNDFAAQLGVKALVSAVLFDEQDVAVAPRTNISLFREPGKPEFAHEDARFLERVQPHLRRALEMYWALAKATALPQFIRQTVDILPTPVLLVRADGFIDFANVAATSLLSSGNILKIKNGRVVAMGGQTDSWTSALKNAALGVGTMLPLLHVCGIQIRSGIARLAPVRENPVYVSVWPNVVAIILIELRDKEQGQAVLTLVAHRYGLTRTEVAVLQRMAEGQSLSTISAELQIALTTVRTHLRNMFNKTGVRRQTDLVRLLSL
jgi:DNA-binding CsgD family transcriptional regulator